MDAQLQALAELLVELLVVVLLLSDLCEHLEALLHKILLDDSQDLVLLQGLTGDVQRQVLRVHHALHEVQPLWHQLLAVVHDEDTTHVQLDVVALLLGLEEVEGRPAGDEEQRTELQLALDAEVLHREVVLPNNLQKLFMPQAFPSLEPLPVMRGEGRMAGNQPFKPSNWAVLPVVGQRLVEGSILLVGNVFGLAHPERLVLVQLPNNMQGAVWEFSYLKRQIAAPGSMLLMCLPLHPNQPSPKY